MEATVRRHRRPEELAALLEPHEPESTLLVANLLERGSSRQARAWTVSRDGRLLGAIVLARAVPTRWYAAPFLLDPSEEVVRALGKAIGQSKAWNVVGPEPHVVPVLAHVPRRVSGATLPFLHHEAPVPKLHEPDPATRVAGPRDLDALVTLYARFEHIGFVPTLRWLRAMLKEMVGKGRVVLIEEDATIAGAVYLERMSRHYAYWTGLTIEPAFRGRKLAWRLIARASEVTTKAGVGFMSVINPTNPMLLKDREPEELSRERWVWARLSPPHRFPGHWTLRRTWIRLHGPAPTPRRHTGDLRDDFEKLGGPATQGR
jgi:hypothetical protein